jgi:hypothetical protein
MNLEPNYKVLGQIVCDAIDELKADHVRKAGLLAIVLQMAEVAHYARANQLQKAYRDGEIDELPEWASMPWARTDETGAEQ